LKPDGSKSNFLLLRGSFVSPVSDVPTNYVDASKKLVPQIDRGLQERKWLDYVPLAIDLLIATELVYSV